MKVSANNLTSGLASLANAIGTWPDSGDLHLIQTIDGSARLYDKDNVFTNVILKKAIERKEFNSCSVDIDGRISLIFTLTA